ncbi:hypothetical protein P8C59_008925 [Phyllachora maydis]|uniref:Uncharacterized protein n=1 Tax=Phyllachora maydis TaxID=1825666 RepID=A0AAD9IDG0_9PEZI|nr:hypothetical protein P8C59_008925 [Phyllachora maydis]
MGRNPQLAIKDANVNNPSGGSSGLPCLMIHVDQSATERVLLDLQDFMSFQPDSGGTPSHFVQLVSSRHLLQFVYVEEGRECCLEVFVKDAQEYGSLVVLLEDLGVQIYHMESIAGSLWAYNPEFTRAAAVHDTATPIGGSDAATVDSRDSWPVHS